MAAEAVGGEVAPPTPNHGTPGARALLYSLMCVCIWALKIIRNAFPSLVPFIVMDRGLNLGQQASLLSSFWAGYATSPLLGAPVVQKYGGKGILTAAMGGTGVICVLLPLVVSAGGGVVALSAMICAMGLLQGPLAPAMSELNRVWMPLGTERIWAQRAQGVAHHLTTLIAAFATPRLCSRGGWPLACYVYGGGAGVFTILWQLLARSRPVEALILPDNGEAAAAGGAVGAGGPGPQQATEKGNVSMVPRLNFKNLAGTGTADRLKEKAVEWGIFSVAATQAMVVFYICYGHLNFTMVLLAPQYFTDKLGCTANRAGELLALCNSVNLPGTLVTGAVEQWMTSQGVALVTIRRLMSGGAALVCSASAVCYGLARTPLQGTLAYGAYTVGHLFHASGIFPYFIELGGPDTALLSSVCATLANIPGLIVPPLGLWLQARTGRYCH
jgi:MFS family permease